MYSVYTDGACSNNGFHNSSGGFGVVVMTENNDVLDAYAKQCTGPTTNNREELKAILYALLTYGKDNPTVYSDSSYCVNTLTDWMYRWERAGWIKSDGTVPENLDLIKEYYDWTRKGFKINLQKIKGHAKIEGNELADRLATGRLTMEEVKNNTWEIF